MASSNETQPLLPTVSTPAATTTTPGSPITVAAASADVDKNPWASFLYGLYTGASNLGNLLPTGTFLSFTAIAPIITSNGTCDDAWEFYITIVVVALFGLFCFFSCFTDSYQAADGKVYYGVVTSAGLWTPLLPELLRPGDTSQYKVTIVDVIHSILSLAVFAACALMTSNICACFYPKIDEDIVTIVPAVVGFVVSSAFVAFPSKRHGVGFPVTPGTAQLLSGSRDFHPTDGTATTGTTKKAT